MATVVGTGVLFDYRMPAAYFVTVCAHDWRCLCGTVRQGRMYLNEIGTIADEEPRCRPLPVWQRSEEMWDEVILDAIVVMPNHIHGLVCLVPPDVDAASSGGYNLNVSPNPLHAEKSPTDDITHDDVGAHCDASLRSNHIRRKDARPRRHAKSLGSMIVGFKGAVTTRANQHRGMPGAPVWQSRFYDRILRNEMEWRACRRYIEQNPSRWVTTGIIRLGPTNEDRGAEMRAAPPQWLGRLRSPTDGISAVRVDGRGGRISGRKPIATTGGLSLVPGPDNRPTEVSPCVGSAGPGWGSAGSTACL